MCYNIDVVVRFIIQPEEEAMNDLRTTRRSLGLTIDDLSVRSGLSTSCISRIETRTGSHKVHEDTAAILEGCLGYEPETLFGANELTDQGRPPKTPGTRRSTRRLGGTCQNCWMVRPLTGVCDNCH